jgi:hypothetical protein
VWLPGETLIIDWGMLAGLHVFCAVLAWSRFRFVRFADNEQVRIPGRIDRNLRRVPVVRGHEKVPTGGQVEVPAGGQIEVPTLRVVS